MSREHSLPAPPWEGIHWCHCGTCMECIRVAQIVDWLRSAPQICDCPDGDERPCRYSSTMTATELADAIEKGIHER